ncbi:MAG: hypothetical protein AB7I19_20370 [Planctomycetota bacterium]
MSSKTLIAGCAASALLLVLAGCGPTQREVVVESGRDVRRPIRGLDASSAERFGSMGAGRSESTTDQEAIPLEVDLPAGWTRLPKVQYRDLNFAGPDGLAAWVSVLSPQASELAHVNRWRGQVGLEAVDAAAIDALPRVTVLGGAALRVDVTAKSGDKRMVGSMRFLPGVHLFVKLEGRPDAVQKHLAEFEAIEASLRMAGSAPRAAKDSASQSPDPAPKPVVPAGSDPVTEPALHWTTPSGWTAKGPGEMKLEQFETADGARVWLTLILGDGGGLWANLSRWTGQVSRAMPTPAEVDSWPRWTVLGRPSLFVRLVGEGDADGLLALIVPLEHHSLFVRMSGPSDVLAAHEAEFRTFCEGLSQ